MSQVFAAADADGSGTIEPNEVISFVHAADPASTPER
jgi:hypothetical protein